MKCGLETGSEPKKRKYTKEGSSLQLKIALNFDFELFL
jgi:hypothetical protein